MDIWERGEKQGRCREREIDWKANDLEELADSAQSFLFVGKLIASMPFSYIQISELPTFKKILSRKWPYSTGSRRKSSSIRGK